MEFNTFIKSKTATAVLGLALILVVFMSVRLYVQKYQVDKEIKKLEEQASKIDSENQQLSELIKYLNTPEYMERQAREKLNLKKEGEQVVVLPSGMDDTGEVAGVGAESETNPKKWYKYLFGAKND
jgi:cell division protein FtsB